VVPEPIAAEPVAVAPEPEPEPEREPQSVAMAPEPEPEPEPAPDEDDGTLPVGDNRVSFVMDDGTLATPELDEKTAARMEYVVTNLIPTAPVRRTT
jgi:hypothetical protein